MKKRVKQKNFPVNQLCFWEDNGECQGYNITSIRDEDGVYKVTIHADSETISDKSTFIESSFDNDVCGYRFIGKR